MDTSVFSGGLAVSVARAAKLLSVSRAGLYNAIARGEVPCVRIGRRVVVPAWFLSSKLLSPSA